MPKKQVPINYTDRDFDSIKKSLVEHARRYYPDVYRDFTQASFGSLLFDTVAYVGDVMSFYLDYQSNESFLNTATERENIVALSKHLGYKYKENITSYGMCDFYISVPSNNIEGYGPDLGYAPILKEGATIQSDAGGNFILMHDIDFSDPSNLVSVARVNPDDGSPIEYAIKTQGQVRSGKIEEHFVEIGEFKRFQKATLELDGVSEILSIEDNEGHRYYEVSHLSQDVVYYPVANRSTDKNMVPNVLKPVAVPRRFTVEHFPGRVEIQFGQGSDEEILSGSFADPSDVVMRKFGSPYVSDPYLDPTNFTTTDKMGISPANTTLSVRLMVDDVETSSASPGSVRTFVDGDFVFDETMYELDEPSMTSTKNSIEVNNPSSIVGDKTIPQVEEIRLHAASAYAAQNRAVTKNDYVAMVYSMPFNFGAVKRCAIMVDRDSFKRNLNLYVLAQAPDSFLQVATPTLKNNIMTWVDNYRMMADTFDILDAKIVNIAIDYEVHAREGYDKDELLVTCSREVQEYFRVLPEIGEELKISEIYSLLGKIEGVSDVTDVTVRSVSKTGYRGVAFSIRSHLSLDGRTLSMPFDHIYELRDTLENIRGTVL